MTRKTTGNEWGRRSKGDKFETQLWNIALEFNAQMQDAAFACLDVELKGELRE